MIDRAEIERFLPQRPPFLLLDRARDFVAGVSLVGLADIGADWPHFAGHFPGHPIMPGVMVIEAMAQTGALLTGKSENLDPGAALLMLAGVERARFRAPVLPGAVLELHVEQQAARSGLYRYGGQAIVDGKRIAEIGFSAKLARVAA